MRIVKVILMLVISIWLIGCENIGDEAKIIDNSEVLISAFDDTPTNKRAISRALSAIEELSERRYAAQVLPALMTSSNSIWSSSNSNILDVSFEILTYSPKDDLSFDICFYTESNEKMTRIACERDISAENISNSGFGTFSLYEGGVKQNKIKIKFSKTFTSDETSKLKPKMYYRVFVSNNNIQDEIGYQNNFQWSGTKFTLYVPKILDEQLGMTNWSYNGTNQDNAQRYVKVTVSTSERDWIDLVENAKEGQQYSSAEQVSQDTYSFLDLSKGYYEEGSLALYRVKNATDYTRSLAIKEGVSKYDSYGYIGFMNSLDWSQTDTYCSGLIRDVWADQGFILDDQDEFEGSYSIKFIITPDELISSDNVEIINSIIF